MGVVNAASYERVLYGAHALRGLAQEIARDGELDAAIDACVRADSVGPVLDPTMYRAKHAALAQDEATLRAVRVLAQLGQDLTGERITPDTLAVDAPASGSRGTRGLSLVEPSSGAAS